MSKFKVGDKVRVREDLVINELYGDYYFNKEMSALKGKVIKIRRAEEDCYNLEGDNWFWTDEMLEEVKEDNKMEKTFRDVIANIKEGEVWGGRNFEISKDAIDGTIDIKTLDRKNINAFGIFFEDKEMFKLQRKEYTFEEAFKAYEEGKEIESCFSKKKFRIYSWEDIFNAKEIKEKWYIND